MLGKFYRLPPKEYMFILIILSGGLKPHLVESRVAQAIFIQPSWAPVCLLRWLRQQHLGRDRVPARRAWSGAPGRAVGRGSQPFSL
jgi:hypothetical protein